jgi:hypothetical protein
MTIRFNGQEHWEQDEFSWQPNLEEKLWFMLYQRELVALANTEIGRNLFGLNDHYPYTMLFKDPVIYIDRESVTYGYLEDDMEQQITVIQPRTGRADIIRKNWKYIYPLLDRMMFKLLPKTENGLLVPAGGATTTFKPEASSSGTIDGYCSHTEGGGASWDTIHDGGGNTAATGGTELLAYIQEGSGSNWISIYRGPAGFNCASINDSHEVQSATMTGRPNQINDIMAQDAGFTKIILADNTTISSGDFDAVTGGECVTRADLGSLSSGSDATMTVNSTGLATIPVDAIIAWAARLSGDTDDSEPTHSGSSGAAADLRWDTADASSSTCLRLAVTHGLPAAGMGAIFFT